jgi:hypothetical protein
MTITVSGPDGSTFAFPDGMSHDAIAGIMQQHYGAAPAVAVAEELKISARSVFRILMDHGVSTKPPIERAA